MANKTDREKIDELKIQQYINLSKKIRTTLLAIQSKIKSNYSAGDSATTKYDVNQLLNYIKSNKEIELIRTEIHDFGDSLKNWITQLPNPEKIAETDVFDSWAQVAESFKISVVNKFLEIAENKMSKEELKKISI